MQDPNFQDVYHQSNSYLSSNFHPRSCATGYYRYNKNRSQFRQTMKQPQQQTYCEEHWCETCDRSFPSLDLLEKHKQQHQKCNIDGCQFIAHPKVITKHIQMQHSSGLYHKIAKLNNPEEIQKWRDERKRKYPTKVNVEKKLAEIKEKIERGEKMGLKQNKHKTKDQAIHGSFKRNHTSGINHQRSQRQRPYPSTMMLTRKSAVPKKIHHVLPSADSLRLLKPFNGIQDIIMEDMPEETDDQVKCDFIIDDDDMLKLPDSSKSQSKLLEEPKVCEALSSLMCNYESSEEEIDNTKIEPLTAFTTIPKNTDHNNKGNIPVTEKFVDSMEFKSGNPVKDNNNKSDEDSGPEETKIDKIEQTNSMFQDKPKLVKSQVKLKPVVNNRLNCGKPRHKIPSTLLQKLLKREVQHERNIILQCIRHVVNNKFFDESIQ